VRASTAILTPNITGSTTLKLSWIWNSIAGHILHADGPSAQSTTAQSGKLLECRFISLTTIHQIIEFYLHVVQRVHWLRARAQRNRWREECLLLTYEMEWTVRYFVQRGTTWESKCRGSPAGAAAYAAQQLTFWLQLAHFANRVFAQTNANYKSPLNV
jgi:hypothetical protein